MFASINHNLLAANTTRNLNDHYTKLAMSTRRLSTGLRIGNSADDAAGLAIRELQRADIAALNQGVRNANDAISLLQVADGALSIIDEKLIRMKELAEQAATGTYNSTQRLMIDSEFQAMASEIDRIANATDFNGIKLLNAINDNFDFSNIMLNQPIIENITPTNFLTNQYSVLSDGNIEQITENIVISGTRSIEYYEDNNKIYKKTIEKYTKDINKNEFIISGTVRETFTSNDPRFALTIIDFNFLTDDSKQLFDNLKYDDLTIHEYDCSSWIKISENYQYIDDTSNSTPIFSNHHHKYIINYDINNDNISDVSFTVQMDTQVTFDEFNANMYLKRIYIQRQNGNVPVNRNETTEHTSIEEINNDSSLPIKIHFGSGNDSAEDYYYIENRDCTTNGLGINDLSIETQDKAQGALVQLSNAVIRKDQVRAYYGAMQNRLENTVSNLTIQAENLQAAESRISDTDIATEMSNFVKNQILTQSAVAMLSQANSLPNLVMSLIQG